MFRIIRIAERADRADDVPMSNMKIVPLISAGDNAVREDAKLARNDLANQIAERFAILEGRVAVLESELVVLQRSKP
jgi:hypothetical protein